MFSRFGVWIFSALLALIIRQGTYQYQSEVARWLPCSTYLIWEATRYGQSFKAISRRRPKFHIELELPELKGDNK